MPATHVVQINQAEPVYVVNKNGLEKRAHMLQREEGRLYVHYLDTETRMDEWVPVEICRLEGDSGESIPVTNKRKRPGRQPRAKTPASLQNHFDVPESSGVQQTENGGPAAPTEIIMTEEEYDYHQHQKARQTKNFDSIIFNTWRIKPWYWSPYPLVDLELPPEPASASASSTYPYPRMQSGSRTPARTHVRTSDLLMGSLGKHHQGISTLWVCHFCFKYMTDGALWEIHKKDCKVHHPPGRKVYSLGARAIWEVDGAKNKLYCQNLSLFGKLFIDIKTLFFDTDNFLFYILTESTSSKDHMLGYFSKEKFSFEGYNLACIVTLPQYQRQGYGLLMIEFSYELSRRNGQVGSPERPLSDLGLRSYLTYWISTLVRFFRTVLSVLPPDLPRIETVARFPDLPALAEEDMQQRKRKKPLKGFEGEVPGHNLEAIKGMMPRQMIGGTVFTSGRTFETTLREDGAAETHVKVRCTLSEIAKATNLRVDDCAFALNECGLLMRRLSDVSVEDEMIVITRSLVEQVAKERNVKPMYMDLSCVQ